MASASTNNKNTLFLGDLSTFCSERDIHQVFSPYGEILEIKIMRSEETYRNLSYGFIKFANANSAKKALNGLNGVLFCGRHLRLGWASYKNKKEPKILLHHDRIESSSVHVSYISYQLKTIITEESLRVLFSTYGVVLDTSIKKSYIDESINRQCGYGFVHFACSQEGIESALASVQGLNDATLDGVCYKCSISHNLEKYLLELQGMNSGGYGTTMAGVYGEGLGNNAGAGGMGMGMGGNMGMGRGNGEGEMMYGGGMRGRNRGDYSAYQGGVSQAHSAQSYNTNHSNYPRMGGQYEEYQPSLMHAANRLSPYAHNQYNARYEGDATHSHAPGHLLGGVYEDVYGGQGLRTSPTPPAFMLPAASHTASYFEPSHAHTQTLNAHAHTPLSTLNTLGDVDVDFSSLSLLSNPSVLPTATTTSTSRILADLPSASHPYSFNTSSALLGTEQDGHHQYTYNLHPAGLVEGETSRSSLEGGSEKDSEKGVNLGEFSLFDKLKPSSPLLDSALFGGQSHTLGQSQTLGGVPLDRSSFTTSSTHTSSSLLSALPSTSNSPPLWADNGVRGLGVGVGPKKVWGDLF
eukprot:gene26199-31638_t